MSGKKRENFSKPWNPAFAKGYGGQAGCAGFQGFAARGLYFFHCLEKSWEQASVLRQRLRRTGSLCFEGEAVIGEALFVAHGDELLLERFVDGYAFAFAVDAGEVFFFAAGVDAVGSGRFL